MLSTTMSFLRLAFAFGAGLLTFVASLVTILGALPGLDGAAEVTAVASLSFVAAALVGLLSFWLATFLARRRQRRLEQSYFDIILSNTSLGRLGDGNSIKASEGNAQFSEGLSALLDGYKALMEHRCGRNLSVSISVFTARDDAIPRYFTLTRDTATRDEFLNFDRSMAERGGEVLSEPVYELIIPGGKESLVIDDMQTTAERSEHKINWPAPYKSLMVVPIMDGDIDGAPVFLGTLSFFSPKPGVFGVRDTALAKALADQLAMHMRNYFDASSNAK